MFTTKINFEIGEAEKHTVSFNYSKWTGKIIIKADGIEKETSYIPFGNKIKEFNLDLSVKENNHINFVIHPGNVFWEKPVIEILINDNLKEIYIGNNKTTFQSFTNIPSNYQNQDIDIFKQLVKAIRILLLISALIFVCIGILIPIITAILHPNELTTNLDNILIGIGISFGLALILYIFSILIKN